MQGPFAVQSSAETPPVQHGGARGGAAMLCGSPAITPVAARDPRSTIADSLMVDEADEEEDEFCSKDDVDDTERLLRAQPLNQRTHCETALRPYIWTKGDIMYVVVHRLRGVSVRPGVSGDGKEICLLLHYPGIRADDLGDQLHDTLVDTVGVGSPRDTTAVYKPLAGVLVRDPRLSVTQPANPNLILFTFRIIRASSDDVIYNESTTM